MELTQGVRFDSLGLSSRFCVRSRKRDMISTPIQAGAIPPMLEMEDVTAKQGSTGFGKTFAFGIPILEHIDPESEAVQAVILAPTRELAPQITDELRDLAVLLAG